MHNFRVQKPTMPPKSGNHTQIVKQHRIQGQTLLFTPDRCKLCLCKNSPSTKLCLIKGPKSKFPGGACPGPP